MIYLTLFLQTICAFAIGVFIAYERRCAGVNHDVRIMALAGGAAGVVGFAVLQITSAPVFDFMIVMGAIAFVSAALLKDVLLEQAVRHGCDQSLEIDYFNLGCTLWAGVACGAGDPRACILVMLIMAFSSVWRGQKPHEEKHQEETPAIAVASVAISGPVITTAIDTDILQRAPDPKLVMKRAGIFTGPIEAVPNSEGMVQVSLSDHSSRLADAPVDDCAQKLLTLARTLRAVSAGKLAASELLEAVSAIGRPETPTLAPVRARNSTRLRDHNTAARHSRDFTSGGWSWAGQGAPVCREKAIRPVQRQNFSESQQ